MKKENKYKKHKIKNKEVLMLFLGILVGLCGGVIGNILINSAFSLINKNYQNNIGKKVIIFLTIISFVIFIWIIISILKKINKLYKKIK